MKVKMYKRNRLIYILVQNITPFQAVCTLPFHAVTLKHVRKDFDNLATA